MTEVLKDYAGYLASGPFYIHSVEKSTDIGETWLQIQENHLDSYQTMLEEKYQNDLNLCKALLVGDMDTCLRIQHVKNYGFIPLDPKKKDNFSHLIYDYSFNILYRIITYAAGVPALYIQELQDKWNHRINNRLVSFDHSFFGADMITSYCTLVQKKSFRQHSIHIKKALAYISSHLSTSITIDSLASCLHVSKGHLSKVFKDEMGESIVSYINREQICHTLPMMQDSEMKIQDICLCVGIEDSNYFSRLFKKYMGISPTCRAPCAASAVYFLRMGLRIEKPCKAIGFAGYNLPGRKFCSGKRPVEGAILFTIVILRHFCQGYLIAVLTARSLLGTVDLAAVRGWHRPATAATSLVLCLNRIIPSVLETGAEPILKCILVRIVPVDCAAVVAAAVIVIGTSAYPAADTGGPIAGSAVYPAVVPASTATIAAAGTAVTIAVAPAAATAVCAVIASVIVAAVTAAIAVVSAIIVAPAVGSTSAYAVAVAAADAVGSIAVIVVIIASVAAAAVASAIGSVADSTAYSAVVIPTSTVPVITSIAAPAATSARITSTN